MKLRFHRIFDKTFGNRSMGNYCFIKSTSFPWTDLVMGGASQNYTRKKGSMTKNYTSRKSEPVAVPGFQKLGFDEIVKQDRLFDGSASCLKWVQQHGHTALLPKAQAALIKELKSEQLLSYISVAREHMAEIFGQANELGVEKARELILSQRAFAQLKVERAILANVARCEYYAAWASKGRLKELDELVGAVRNATKSQADHALACQKLQQAHRQLVAPEPRAQAANRQQAFEKRMLTLMVSDRAFMFFLAGELSGWMLEEVEQRGSGTASWKDLPAPAITKIVKVMKPLFRRYKVEAVARAMSDKKLMDKVFMMLPDDVKYEIELRSFDPYNTSLWDGCSEATLSKVAYEIRKHQRLVSPQVEVKITSTPKKPGSASKRKPRVRDEDGKLVKTGTRSLSAREARQKSKGKG